MSDIPDLPPTIAQLPFFASGRFPKPDLIGQCRAEVVTYTSGRELIEIVRDLSLGLSALGMSRGDRVALLSESRPDWLFADFAILAAGAVTTPIYPTLSAEQIAYVLRDSEATLAIVSTAAQLAKIRVAAPDVPSLRAVVVIDDVAQDAGAGTPCVMTLNEVAARGHRRILDGWGVGRAFRDEAMSVRPEDVATVVYTSGTTGQPKGVVLTHGNLIANIAGVKGVLRVDESDVALSFLPLCHAFERLVAYFYLASGCSIVFAESLESVARDLGRIRPTAMTGVPRVFEKLLDRVLAAGREAPGIKRAVFNWALRVAAAHGARLDRRASVSAWRRLEHRLADRLVFRQVRDAVGGRMRFAVCGSAPLRVEIEQLFYGLGLPILEGYGLTETAPVLTVMPLEAIRFGTVGPPLPNVELRIADDGEILARGPNVMTGYFKRPAETAEALRDGWFHTGDIGSLDADGYLRITDRKKELLVTSGGKKVAPQPIEAALRAKALVAEAMLIGDRRRFPAALIVPDFDALGRQLGGDAPRDEPAARVMIERDDVRSLFSAVIDDVNAKLAQFERIKRFALLPLEFSLEGGELTPSLKLKRRVIEDKYRDIIEALYAEEREDQLRT